MGRFINPRPQFFDDAGDPLIKGKVFIFNSGSATDKDLFFDVNLSEVAPNPVILSASGRMPNIFFSGTANGRLTNADETQFWSIDPIETTSAGQGGFPDWNAVTIWNIPDVVVASDDRFYISITDGQQGNDPTTDTTNWSEVKFTGVYNVNETYSIDDLVQASDGLLYVSLTNSNINNDPTIDESNWQPASNSADTTGPALAFFLGTG